MSAPKRNLQANALGLVDVIGQSVANIGPSLTPAINIALIAGWAGDGSWLSFAVATVGMLFVAYNIAVLSRRHTLSGSYFLYVARTFGPLAGLVTGWLLIGAYLMTGVAIAMGFVIFLRHLLDALGVASAMPAPMIVFVVFVAATGAAAFRSVSFSARFGLVLEFVSIAILVAMTVALVAHRGMVIDMRQFELSRFNVGGVMTSLTFAVFCFVGFESAATRAGETRNPGRNVPLAITTSVLATGFFFIAMAYMMVMGFDDDTRRIADSHSPLTELARRAGLSSLSVVLYLSALISSCACLLASLNAVSRLLFSMSRYGLLPDALSRVHPVYRSPTVALGVSLAVILALGLAMLPAGVFGAFEAAGALATFGFLVIYLLICLAAPLDQHKAGALGVRHVLASLCGVAAMAFVLVGSVYPVPPWPQRLLPYLFAVYALLGVAWFHRVLRRDAGLSSRLVMNLEG